uniref:Uncharacterized protein n=1 Tax=Ditylenchus dipsaci TaxID=166011 RepID=A0A915DZ64_9BILA
MIGWFSIGREDGAPTWYGGENQTPVVLDLHIAALLSAFITPILAFLIILPGIRRLRAISCFTFYFLWLLELLSWYPCTIPAGTRVKLNAILGVKLGLRHVNITFSSKIELQGAEILQQIVLQTNSALPIDAEVLVSSIAPPPELDYNERFEFNDVSSMELDRTLEKGLPYPILKVIEYLSVDRTGFLWGKQYRLAGYYTYCILWFAFSCWLLQMVLLCALPHKFAQCVLTVGLVTVVADAIYAINVPQQLAIRFPGPGDTSTLLQFTLSTSFYATSVAGISSIIFGLVLWLLERKTGYVFETFLSAYLDEMCRRRRPSKRQRTMQAIAKQLNPAVNTMSLPSTPMNILNSSCLPSCSTTTTQSPMSGETELGSLEEGEVSKKQSITSSSLGDGEICEDLCLTSSSCGGSVKSVNVNEMDSGWMMTAQSLLPWDYSRDSTNVEWDRLTVLRVLEHVGVGKCVYMC